MKIHSRIIFCPKCLTLQFGTRHHVYPVRFFGNGDKAPILYLCEKCHKAIEEIIPRFEELEPEEYLEIVRDFLTGKVRRKDNEFTGSRIY